MTDGQIWKVERTGVGVILDVEYHAQYYPATFFFSKTIPTPIETENKKTWKIASFVSIISHQQKFLICV